MRPEVVTLGDGDHRATSSSTTSKNPALAYLLGRMRPPDVPDADRRVPAVERPCYEDAVGEQLRTARASSNQDLARLLASGDTWTIPQNS